VDASCITTTFRGLLAFDSVELFQNLDRNREDIVVEREVVASRVFAIGNSDYLAPHYLSTPEFISEQ
jgi:hypothetical protein